MSNKDEYEDNDNEVVGSGGRLSDRHAYMEEIANALDENEDARERGSDNGYLKDPDEQVDTDEGYLTDEEEQVVEEPVKHKIKVNGRELELSYEELVARAQKVEAADEYLRQAAQAAQIAQTNINKQNTSAPSQDVQDYVEEDDIALVRALQMGDEKEAVAAIRKLKAGAAPVITPGMIQREVDERVKFQKAAEYFQSEYQDVLSDPYLAQMAFQRDAQLTQEGDTRSYMERFNAIGDEIREWKNNLVGKYANENTSVQKQQRKASMSSVPGAAVRSGNNRREVEQEENASDVIAAIARSRAGRNI